MKQYPVITISRQYGSGGREVGQLLAERLGIPYFDNELISLAAKESGFAPELFANADQNASNSLLFSLSLYGTTTGTYNMPIGDQVFLIQSDIIRKVAEQGPCVIVGRCADYVLHENVNCLSVFLRAPLEWRIEHAVTKYDLARASAKDVLNRTDKKRSVYYTHFTGEKWGISDTYHVTVDTSRVGINATAAMLCGLAQEWENR